MPIYADIYDGPPRSYGGRTTKRYVVIHNTSNDATAEAEASYAKRRTDGVSSHYYVDSNSIVQSLDTDLRANHVGSSTGNNTGISYEITGVNGWSRAQWLDRVAWPLLAAAVRRDCAEHDIVPRTLTVEQIKAGAMSGIITHNQARLAWGRTTHIDPGPNFPLDYLIELVQDDEQEEDDMALTPEQVQQAFVDVIAEAAARQTTRGRHTGDRLRSIMAAPAKHYAGKVLDLLHAQQPLLEAAAQGLALSPEQVAQVAAAIAAAVQDQLADEVADELAHRLADDA